MNTIRILRFAATVGLGTYLYKSLSGKVNTFNVKAQPSPRKLGDWDISNVSVEETGHECDLPKPQTSTPVNPTGKSYATPTSLITPLHKYPTVKSLGECDFTLVFNYRTGLPRWTLEHVKKEKFAEDEHKCDYCTKVATGNVHHETRDDLGPDVIKFHMKYMLHNTTYNLDPCVLITHPPQIHKATVQNNSLWDDFYHYIRFLTLKYKNVYVCSGPIFTTIEHCCPDSEDYYGTNQLTNFFKVILTELDDGSYRYECYKFPNCRIELEHPELRHFREPRSDIELYAGFLIFQDVKPFMIKETTTHPDFCPHWKCPKCFPPLTE